MKEGKPVAQQCQEKSLGWSWDENLDYLCAEAFAGSITPHTLIIKSYLFHETGQNIWLSRIWIKVYRELWLSCRKAIRVPIVS